MFYHMNSTLQNTIFYIFVNVPLRSKEISDLKIKETCYGNMVHASPTSFFTFSDDKYINVKYLKLEF